MKKQTLYILLLAGIILLAGCAPKVIGKRKHKKIRDCGCELLQGQNDCQNAEIAYFSEIEDE